MLRLLLIEDNPADVELVREALQRFSIPAHLHVAMDGEQAVGLLGAADHKPDLIILDLNVPKIDGHQLLERHSLTDSPVVVFSSSNNVVDREWALANGAKDYVVKPEGFKPFLKAVRDMVERWGTSAPAD